MNASSTLKRAARGGLRPAIRVRKSDGQDDQPTSSEEDGPDSQVIRARRSGGPEDLALYRCACGTSFEAPVSASVRCPSCGADQAW